MSGRRNLRETEDFTDKLPGYSRDWLGIEARIPATTLRDTLVRLDPQEVRTLLHSQCKAAQRRGDLEAIDFPFSVLAIDGKTTALKTFEDQFVQRRTLSESNEHGVARTLTCSLVFSRSTFCIDANPIPASTSEMGHFKSTINQLLEIYQGMSLFEVVSADAGMCSKDHGQFLADKGLHYLFALKDPRSYLHRKAKEVLGGLASHQCKAMTTDVLGRKYSVIRRLYLTNELAGTHGWDSLKTVLRIEAIKINNDTGEKVSGEDRYFLSDLRCDSLTGLQWLKMIRAHWSIENDCHCTLDKAFKEDARPWIRADGQGFLVVLILRRIALNILSLFRSSTDNQKKRGKALVKLAWKRLLEWCYLALLGSLEDEAGFSGKRGASDITLV